MTLTGICREPSGCWGSSGLGAIFLFCPDAEVDDVVGVEEDPFLEIKEVDPFLGGAGAIGLTFDVKSLAGGFAAMGTSFDGVGLFPDMSKNKKPFT